MVWKLDRLGRSLSHLLAIVTDLKARDVGLRSLTERMDTTTAQGKLLFSAFGALADLSGGGILIIFYVARAQLRPTNGGPQQRACKALTARAAFQAV